MKITRLIIFLSFSLIVFMFGCKDRIDYGTTAPELSGDPVSFELNYEVILGSIENTEEYREVIPIEWDGVSELQLGTVYKLRVDQLDALAAITYVPEEVIIIWSLLKERAKSKAVQMPELAGDCVFSPSGALYAEAHAWCYEDSGKAIAYSVPAVGVEDTVYHEHTIISYPNPDYVVYVAQPEGEHEYVRTTKKYGKYKWHGTMDTYSDIWTSSEGAYAYEGCEY